MTRRHVSKRRARDLVALTNRGRESFALFLESLLVSADIEGRLQVVLVRRVLVKTPYEVGDRRGEIIAPGNRRVQQNALAGLRDGERFGVRHPFEHFDVNLLFDAS